MDNKYYRLAVLPKENEIVVDSVKLKYCQQCDKDNEEWQELRISTANQGGGFYYVIKTKRWAFDDIDQLIDTLNDFKNRFHERD